MKINRLLQIIVLLLNKNNVTVRYLAEQFNVSKKTIYRDLETLITSEIPICYGDNQKGHVYLLEGYSLKYAFLPTKKNERMIFDVEALGKNTTFNPDTMIRDYSKAWQCFISHRNFDALEIKREIRQSWVRCQQKRVSLYDIDIENLVKPEETSKYVLNHLPEYSEEGFKTFRFIVKNLELDISIYDAYAHLKYIINIDPMYGKLYPKIGYFKDVSEHLIGTNSTSLAIAENMPCMVIGPEHYKKSFHEFSCVAAPIYDGMTLIGTVNASFVHTSITTDTLNIIYSLARLYESLVIKKNNMYLNKKMDEEQFILENKPTSRNIETFDTILGESRQWQAVKDIVRNISNLDTPVVIKGEVGSGKKTLARCMHNESKRRNAPCITFDCKSIPTELIEITLFGYESLVDGVSKKEKKGLIEQVTGGTLIIEHLDALSEDLQKQLYKFLVNGKIRRLGGKKQLHFDVRIIVCLSTMDCSSIYEPLFNELELLQLYIPPLRERREDIRIISEKRVSSFIEENGFKQFELLDIMRQLEQQPWLGNVAELFNTLDKLIVLASSTEQQEELYDLLNQIMIA